MNTDNQTARRYYWSDKLNLENRTDFIDEPHKGIASQKFLSGGKDATPYPVDKETYDKTIEIMRQAVAKTKLNYAEKSKATRRLISS